MRKDELMEVKEGLEKKYEEYVGKNQDGYGNGVIVAGAKVGKALTEGKTCKEAEDEMFGCDLTGFMAGCVAQSIKHYHKRGDEFNKHWNKKYGIKEDTEGTVNPAIMTLG